MKGLAVGAFKLVAGAVVGAGLGYIAIRAGMGAYALDGTDLSLAVGTVTGLGILGAATVLASNMKSKAAQLGLALGILGGSFETATTWMDRTLLTAKVNDATSTRSLGFKGACAEARLEKFGEGIRFVLPTGCSLKP